MQQPIFDMFEPKHRELFGNSPLRLQHSLHTSPFFSMEALAELIERYPRSEYSLVHMANRVRRGKRGVRARSAD